MRKFFSLKHLQSFTAHGYAKCLNGLLTHSSFSPSGPGPLQATASKWNSSEERIMVTCALCWSSRHILLEVAREWLTSTCPLIVNSSSLCARAAQHVYKLLIVNILALPARGGFSVKLWEWPPSPNILL